MVTTRVRWGPGVNGLQGGGSFFHGHGGLNGHSCVLAEVGRCVARSVGSSWGSKLLYMEAIVLQKNCASLLQRSCEGVMLLEASTGEVKSFTIVKIFLLLLVQVSIQ